MARPIAPRFEITTLKNKSGVDPGQVPASANVNFYRQGATVSQATSVLGGEGDVLVPVYDRGDLVVDDLVRVGVGPQVLGITGASVPTNVLVSNPGFDTVTLAVGTRLVPTGNRPNVYADPLATVSLGTSIVTDATTGRGSAYLSRDRVDYDVNIAGQPLRLYLDGAGLCGRSDQRMSDLRDYGGSLAAAIAALPDDGGIVFVPRGTWLMTAGVTITKPDVAIVGEGVSSYLKAGTPNSFDMITVERPGFRLADLTMDGAAASYDPGGKCCIVVRGPSHSGQSVAGMSLRNVIIENAPRFGLWLREASEFFAKNAYFLFNKGSGARIEGGASGGSTTRFVGGGFGQNGGRGCEAAQILGLLYFGCFFEGNQGGAGPTEGNGVDAEDCRRVELRSCYFEDAHSPTRAHQFAAFRRCLSAVVDGCWFQGGTPVSQEPYRPRQAVLFSQSRSARFSNCAAEEMTDYVARFDEDSPDCIEFGNRDFQAIAGITRLRVESARFFGMSRRTLNAPEHFVEGTLPSASSMPAGSLVWVESPATGHSQLQVSDGSVWRNLTIT